MEEDTNSKVRTWSYIVLTSIGVYVLINVLLAFLRPDYSLVHNAESDYGRGPYSWVMDIAFLLRCAFSLLLIKALWTTFPKDTGIRKASYWMVISAVASGLLAFFADTPYGYTHVWTTPVHSFLAVAVFFGLIIGMALLNKRFLTIPSWRKTAALLTCITVLAVISLVLMKSTGGFSPHGAGGLFERIFLVLTLIWQGIVAVKMISMKKPL